MRHALCPEGNIMKIFNRKYRKPDDISDLFLANYPGRSHFAEAFRTLRTNIQFSFMEKDLGSILITSAGEEEGKTSAVANLAYTMAQAGKAVLMVDADLRKPILSRLVSSDNSPGLSGIITDVFGFEIKRGSLKDLTVSDLFRLLTFQKKTGQLHLTEATEKVDLLFLQGELKEIHWLTRPEGRKLANSLVKNGIVKKEDLERALVRHKAMARRLGFTLLNMGLLKEDELVNILNVHMTEGLRTALQFTKGEYVFNELDKSDFEHASFDPVDFHKLYNQAVAGREELNFIKNRIEPAIIKTAEENLFLLPSGKAPHNPSEMLASARLPFLINLLKRRFDLIVIDSPPILPTSDALLLAPHADGVVLVTRSGMINKEMVKKAADQLRQTGANLIGVALNAVDINRESYYRNYYKYYSKYYGEDD
jgi:capsular exopolysaccharide synthesis family protein